jgi:hypothetical protein
VTDLASRYGSPSRLRRPTVLTVVALIAAAGLAWLVWAIAFHSSPQVTSQLVSYDVAAGQHRVDTRVTVVRHSPDVTAHCLLRAFAEDHAVVGEDNLTVGPGGSSTTTLSRAIRTERRATSAELVGCTAEGQAQPR